MAECPLQFEATAVGVELAAGGDFLIIQARVLRVHADESIVVPGTSHVDPSAWSPLIYNFRHYFGLGDERGESFRSETPRPAPNDPDRGHGPVTQLVHESAPELDLTRTPGRTRS